MFGKDITGKIKKVSGVTMKEDKAIVAGSMKGLERFEKKRRGGYYND